MRVSGQGPVDFLEAAGRCPDWVTQASQRCQRALLCQLWSVIVTLIRGWVMCELFQLKSNVFRRWLLIYASSVW